MDVSSFLGNFISSWFRFFRCEVFSMSLEPIKGHGTWDGKQPFEFSSTAINPDKPIATLTRATIKLSKMNYFWANVASAANSMLEAKGFLFSVGIGEVPWIKQATFSVWSTEKEMMEFAYGTKAHADIVKKTRKEKWYSEDMFVRFQIVNQSGTLLGKNPLPDNL